VKDARGRDMRLPLARVRAAGIRIANVDVSIIRKGLPRCKITPKNRVKERIIGTLDETE